MSESNAEKSQAGAGGRLRSPNYPAISLKRAVDLANKQYEKDRMQSIPIGLARTRWGFGQESIQADLYLAAMKAYGLIVVTGKGKDRQVAVSDATRRIILRAQDRDKVLRSAALAPRVHRDIWEKYNGEIPQDDVLSHHLIFDLGFNENAVAGFIAKFRETISYANLLPCRISDGAVDGLATEDDEHRPKIEVGDTIQWTSQGADQFVIPQRVTSLSENGTHVFVEGSQTGIPTDQVSKVEPPLRQAVQPVVSQKVRTGMNQDVFTLEEGQVVLQWPAILSEESYKDFKSWFDLVDRRIKRAAGVKDVPPHAESPNGKG